MDYQTKNMIINTLTKIVEDAPTKPTVKYGMTSPAYTVSGESFGIWINYIFSVMQIISSYVDVNTCLTSINNVVQQPNSNNDYSLQVNTICQIILDFARTILYL
ncbi:hypothetical protein [Subdoligranulum variabile]|uniref:Uncharacterized protein n=1 Tax=Subdoligranulum variabile DSM 15176 TaxID=411471 RepID=D1PNU6_9FIRM|nr:hypothetical protein [Subdoligranulum variabile]EFB76231.1 hypothetical protein SUBVAR_06017 [Subdoligranulum variabile DSM 15176]UWP68862.1 hypothetical protein NQ490_03135 [Subdoligranulum variabile]